MRYHQYLAYIVWSGMVIIFLLPACQRRPPTPPTPTPPPTAIPTPTNTPPSSSRQTSAQPAVSARGEEPSQAGTALEVDLYAAEAPEFPADLEWLNTDRPLTLAELRGKIVILDFWTYGCINCQHNFPDLKRLEEEYQDELVVIGVHSGKFDAEKETENIRQTILRYGLDHPVINDRDQRVWYDWGVQAWPTLTIIDPDGLIYGLHIGENVYRTLKPTIQSLVRIYDKRLDRTPLRLKLERQGLPQTVLSFPSKVLADAAQNRLFIADTDHNRIVIADMETGDVQGIIGHGDAGFDDGDFKTAAFSRPQGMALSDDGQTLYIADTANHAIRQVDLTAETVTTLAGNGRQANQLSPEGGIAPDVALSSPWDVLLDGDQLYIAMTGVHQIWRLDLPTGQIGPIIGNAFEGLTNGSLAEAELAQPSGLARDSAGRLLFVDAESSLVRWAEFDSPVGDASPMGEVGILAGGSFDLFAFGDIDGQGSDVRFQHPLGIASQDNVVFIADTYNHKIKRIAPDTNTVETLVGSESGWRDGDDPLFFEPGGLDIAGNKLYVADTNNHAIRIINLNTRETETLVLKGIDQFTASADEDNFRGKIVELESMQVGSGSGQISLNIDIPEGYKVNEQAPASMAWRIDGDIAVLAPDANRSIIAPQFPLKIGATFKSGTGNITADLAIYYCEATAESLCLIEQVRLTAPVVVNAGSSEMLNLDYGITLPILE